MNDLLSLFLIFMFGEENSVHVQIEPILKKRSYLLQRNNGFCQIIESERDNCKSSKKCELSEMLSFCLFTFYDDSDGQHQITTVLLYC